MNNQSPLKMFKIKKFHPMKCDFQVLYMVQSTGGPSSQIHYLRIESSPVLGSGIMRGEM